MHRAEIPKLTEIFVDRCFARAIGVVDDNEAPVVGLSPQKYSIRAILD
jgi:hypothetical protein